MLKVTAFKKNAIGTSLEILEQLYLYSVLHFFMVSLDKKTFLTFLVRPIPFKG